MADPQYCYFDAPRRDALARLLSGLFRGDGLFLLTGRNGIGKTTLLRHLADQLAALQGVLLLSPAHPLACRPSTHLTDVFEACDRELGLREVAAEPLKVARRLQDLADVDRTPVLLLDDADLLSDEVLAEIATLATLRSAERGLLSVVLAGTPDLAVRLAAARGGAVNAAPADDHVVALQPLTPAEARNLILFRLKVAGFGDGEPLTADALTAIAAHGQGVPLEIVRTARRALQIAGSRSLPAVTLEIVAEATGGTSPEQPEAGRVAKLFDSPTAPAPAGARPRPADRAQVATPRGDPPRPVNPAAPSAAPAAPTAAPTAAAEPPPAPFRIDKPADRRLADGSFAASAPSDHAPADPSAHLPADAAKLPSTARPSADWLRRPRRPINGPDSAEPWLAAPPSVPPAEDRFAPVWRVDDRGAAKLEPLPPPSSTAGPLPPPRGETKSIDEILRTPSGAGLRGTPPWPQRRRRIKIVLAGVALLVAALLAVAILVAESKRGGESIGAKLPSHAPAGDDVAAVPPSAPPSVPPPAAPLLTPEEWWHPEPPEPPPAGVAPVERPDASTPLAAPGMAGSTATPASPSAGPSAGLPASPPASPSAGLPASPPPSPPVSSPASAARSAPSVPAEEAPEQGYLPPPKPAPPLRAAPPPNATTSRQPPPVATTPREPPSDSAPEQAAVPPPARLEKPLTRRQEIEALLSEGDSQFEAGDLAAARSVFQEAYEKGSKAAALRMAHTFDPRIVSPGNGASPSEAILWYQDAARKGDRRARDGLNSLASWLETAAASGDREARRTLELWRAPPEDDAPAPEDPAP